ncbi:hypothetical protein BUL40_10365 [Croceivirga radicis]|uniref:Uncharacterized protein n=1 Tax=Croceivirga radicis TaxID=1929488 RepID=A0A1V6LQP7_9FLAO|nr:hypothetical protein [Croceivirga radicis]OQD42515.1 hypothetical protein BUL40_10365 [Croceivirga radicis]
MKDPKNPIPESILKIIKQQNKMLGKVYPYMEHFDKEYDKMRGYFELGNQLRKSNSRFEDSPTGLKLDELVKFRLSLEKAKEELESNPFYQLSQYENSELQIENDSIKKELENLEKIHSNFEERIKHADFIIDKFSRKPINNKGVQLTLKPNFIAPNWQILKLFENSQELFESNLEQWQNLFSANIEVFVVPIKLKPGTTISELRYFLDMLMQKQFIKR